MDSTSDDRWHPEPIGPPPARPYSPVVSARGLIFTAGQVAVRGPDRVPVDGDITEQTTVVLQNLETVLSAAGANLTDVIATRVLLIDPADVDAMDEVYQHAFSRPFPVRTTCAVAQLGRPEFRVEIDAIAIAPQPQ